MLGMDPRCSPLTLFLRMRGELPDDPDNEAMLQGRYYERATAEIACHKYGMQLIDGYDQLAVEDGVLSGHPDFIVADESNRLVICEVKNPFFSYKGDGWGDPGTDQVPVPYWIQSMIYAHLLRVWHENQDHIGLAMCYPGGGPMPVADYAYVVARLHGGVERFKVPFDKDIVERVRREAEMFLTRVQIDDPPDPQDEQDMRNRWPVSEGVVAECGHELLAQVQALVQVKKAISDLEKQETAIKTLLLGYMKDAEALDYVDHAAGTRQRILEAKANRKLDEAALIAAHPDLLTRYPALDTAKLRKEQKGLVEAFMRRPEKATEQTRVLRVKLKEENDG